MEMKASGVSPDRVLLEALSYEHCMTFPSCLSWFWCIQGLALPAANLHPALSMPLLSVPRHRSNALPAARRSDSNGSQDNLAFSSEDEDETYGGGPRRRGTRGKGTDRPRISVARASKHTQPRAAMLYNPTTKVQRSHL